LTKAFLGIDVGGTNLRFGVFDEDRLLASYQIEWNLHQRCAEASSEQAPQLVVEALASGYHRLREQCPEIQGVGVAFPGFINGQGVLLQSPNLPQLLHFPLEQALQETLQVPVLLENDANAAAFGTYISEKAHDPHLQDLIYAGLGTGVGGGWIHQGRPWRGENGAAMEIGHLIVVPGGRRCGCGNQGCLEQYASAQGLVSSYLEISGMAADPRIIAQLARDGNPQAQQAFGILAEHLGQALAHLTKVLDCREIRVGGGLSQAWDCFGDTLQQKLQKYMIPALSDTVQLMPGNGDDQAGIWGAASLARALLFP